MNTYSIKIEEAQSNALNTLLKEESWDSRMINHAKFAYKKDGLDIIAYNSGTLLIKGEGTEKFVLEVLEEKITFEKVYGRDEELNPQYYECHAGADESGKGDFFGPLVAACVIAEPDTIRLWVKNGLKESKAVKSDNEVLKLAEMIEGSDAIIEISYYDMQTYNKEYKSLGENSLNYILADLHATAIRAAIRRKPVAWGMLDQFTEEKIVQKKLNNDDFYLKMETRAERDPVVAAASIIARATFLRELSKLSDEAGIKLNKGASSEVENQASELIRKFGKEGLSKFAKMNFKTLEKI